MGDLSLLFGSLAGTGDREQVRAAFPHLPLIPVCFICLGHSLRAFPYILFPSLSIRSRMGLLRLYISNAVEMKSIVVLT